MFMVEHGLGIRVFPSIARMEREVLGMVPVAALRRRRIRQGLREVGARRQLGEQLLEAFSLPLAPPPRTLWE